VSRSAAVQWAVVYICEAHASDVWPLGYSYEQPRPKSLCERAAYARRCSCELGFDAAGFRLLCDPLDDRFNAAFGVWPTAYLLVDRSGKLLHVGEAEGDKYGYDVRRFVDVVRRAARAQQG